jgi:hypothetical protein
LRLDVLIFWAVKSTAPPLRSRPTVSLGDQVDTAYSFESTETVEAEVLAFLLDPVGCEARKTPTVGDVFFLDLSL